MPEPAHHRGASRQDYRTPVAFLQAVLARLGVAEFVFDFAADETNSVSACYWGAEQNSLGMTPEAWAWQVAQPYMAQPQWGWLNPPFARIAPWVELAYRTSLAGGKVAVLVPAGVGSNWWRDWVHEKAQVLLLNGRLTFEGCEQPYPKDCALLLYDAARPLGMPALGDAAYYQVWDWRNTNTNTTEG